MQSVTTGVPAGGFVARDRTPPRISGSNAAAAAAVSIDVRHDPYQRDSANHRHERYDHDKGLGREDAYPVALPAAALPFAEPLAAASGTYPFQDGHSGGQYFTADGTDARFCEVGEHVSGASHVEGGDAVRSFHGAGATRDNCEFAESTSQSPALKFEDAAEKYNEEQPAVRPKGRRFSRAEVDLLNDVFRRNENPDIELRGQLAELLGNGVTPRIVYVWFQNRRQKKRREEVMCSIEQDLSLHSVGDKKPKRGRPRKNLVQRVPHNALSEADDCAEQTPKSTTPKRRRFVPDQLAALNEAFAENPRPDAATRQQLSQSLRVPLHSVDVWFQNQRQRARRQTLPGNTPTAGRASAGGLAEGSATADGQVLNQSGLSDSALATGNDRKLQNIEHANFEPPTGGLAQVMYYPSKAGCEARRLEKEGGPPSDSNSEASNMAVSLSVRLRRRMTEEDLDTLNSVFVQTQNPDSVMRYELAKKLGATPKQIRSWFQNQKQKLRRGETVAGMTLAAGRGGSGEMGEGSSDDASEDVGLHLVRPADSNGYVGLPTLPSPVHSLRAEAEGFLFPAVVTIEGSHVAVLEI
ncbi:MAG: hypothetical protein BJ554DRAFT_1692 [Olpidium bornovanus]|uniref:Homeobox domain-containing protein n=1 Tax=Olpidium bornovanus TaxID=278681 RepID=A0A8H7ZRN5_9FUNG|nr:MAG: hypothetical protein BJ554DRAFT_1692 [Olpidium bornovanus]